MYKLMLQLSKLVVWGSSWNWGSDFIVRVTVTTNNK